MRLFEDIDTDHNGLVDWNEFIHGLVTTPRVSVRISNLISQFPDMIDQIDEEGQTALYIAAGCGNTDIVKLLLSSNALPNVAGKNGKGAHQTPLHGCCRYHNVFVRYLSLSSVLSRVHALATS